MAELTSTIRIETDAEVEAEIERLKNDDFVRLAQKEERVRYKRRQRLYQLRSYQRKGRELAAAGITFEMLEAADIE